MAITLRMGHFDTVLPIVWRIARPICGLRSGRLPLHRSSSSTAVPNERYREPLSVYGSIQIVQICSKAANSIFLHHAVARPAASLDTKPPAQGYPESFPLSENMTLPSRTRTLHHRGQNRSRRARNRVLCVWQSKFSGKQHFANHGDRAQPCHDHNKQPQRKWEGSIQEISERKRTLALDPLQGARLV